MVITPHIAVGAALGIALRNPWVVAPVALLSHYALDLIVHWQETLPPYEPIPATFVRLAADLPLALMVFATACLMEPQAAGAIVIGSMFALLPDLDALLVYAPHLRRGVIRSHWRFHCAVQNETESFWGLVPQLGVVVVALLAAHVSGT